MECKIFTRKYFKFFNVSNGIYKLLEQVLHFSLEIDRKEDIEYVGMQQI